MVEPEIPTSKQEAPPDKGPFNLKRAMMVVFGLWAVLFVVGLHYGFSPRDLDDLKIDPNRTHTQSVGSDGVEYRVYRATGSVKTDRIVFTLKEPGNYEIKFEAEPGTSDSNKLPKNVTTTVSGWQWVPVKIDIVQELPVHFQVSVTKNNLDPKDPTGSWSMGGPAE